MATIKKDLSGWIVLTFFLGLYHLPRDHEIVGVVLIFASILIFKYEK